VREQLEQAINVTGGWTEIQRDAAQAQSASSAQVTAAWQGFVSEVTDQVMPSLVALVPHLTQWGPVVADLIPAFGRLLEGVGDLSDGFLKVMEALDMVDSPEARAAKKAAKETKGERAARTAKELDAFNNQLGRSGVMGTPTLADLNKQEQLEKAAEKAAEENNALESFKQRKDVSPSEFAGKFAGASKYAPGSPEYQSEFENGLRLSKRIKADPTGDFRAGSYSPGQTELVNARKDQEQAGVADTLNASMKQLEAAVAALAKSAGGAARNLDNVSNSARNKPNSER